MPEMPEVDAVSRRLREAAAGERIKSLRILRGSIAKPQHTEEIEAAVKGRTLITVRRRAKHIFLEFSGGAVIHIHLRMTGNLFVTPDARLFTSSARAVFHLSSGRGIVFEDSRALGKLHLRTISEITEIESELGWEPLDPAFTVAALGAMAKASAMPAKTFLMDQRYVAGLGNIYVAEVLHRAKVDPRKAMKTITRPAVARIHQAIGSIMNEAVESVYSAYEQPGGFAEGEIFPVQVYDREGEPCFRCKTEIRRIKQGGRSTYFCPGCQR